MTGAAIYLEGGGDSAEQKARLRQGIGDFLSDLRDRARARQLRWKIVPCGGRVAAHDAFAHAQATDLDTLSVLLVDSEDPVMSGPIEHLRTRDGWPLNGVQPDQVHLMVQSMETWIVADADALAAYYGHFHRNALPAAIDLETVGRADVAATLAHATKDTQKGGYRKIRHGADLLSRLDTARVQARCPHCRRLFERLAEVLERL